LLHDEREHTRVAAAARMILTAEAFGQAWDEGRAMTLGDAVRYALDEQVERDS
jgi:hypothetical protein